MALRMRNPTQFAQNTLGYTFLDADLLFEALDTTGLRSPESNQRLAMLGDAILKLIILNDWYLTGTPKGA